MEDARLAAHSDRAERYTDDCYGGRLVSTGTHFVGEAAVRGVDAVEVAWERVQAGSGATKNYNFDHSEHLSKNLLSIVFVE